MLGIGATAMAAEVAGMQVHSGDPGAAGTSNTTTAAREAATMTATGAALALDATVSFTGGAASGTASWVSLWDNAVSGGNWLGNAQITSGDTSFNAAGELDVTAVAITGS